MPINENPILFSGPMVRAILEGRKTQTRRVVKNRRGVKVDVQNAEWVEEHDGINGTPWWAFKREINKKHSAYGKQLACNSIAIDTMFSAYGKPGDRLWVRETFQPLFAEGESTRTVNWKTGKGYSVSYLATDGVKEFYDEANDNAFSRRCKPGIHMPRWASRLTLEITDIRVERLQEISGRDCAAEGMMLKRWLQEDRGEGQPFFDRGIEADGRELQLTFRNGWDALNAKRGYSWETNPFVWCISFRRIDGETK